jgi:hypothetical protein
VAAAVVERDAALPTCAAGDPAASDTPGYPNSVHAADEVFVNTMGMYVDPAAPCAAPTESRRSLVVHAAAPAAAGEVDPAACGDDADEGDEAADEAADEGEEAADEAAAEEDPAAEEEDDEDDDEHPAETATTAPAAITPSARSSHDAKPAITNHSFWDPVTS